MRDPLICWKPRKLVTNDDLISALLYYTADRPANFRLYENGTVLFIKADGDTEVNAHRCLEELKFISDFKVHEMKNGNFYVSPHEVGAVLILNDELAEQLDDLNGNEDEAKLPGEVFLLSGRNLPIGLVGRAKIWKDASDKIEIHHHVC
jgi:hypothetical protein